MIYTEYNHCIVDDNGFIHSIDNVVYVYMIKSFNMEKISNELIDIRIENDCDGWEKLNCTACTKFSWYQNIIHIDSMHISFGKYHEYDKTNKTWIILPLLRFEVNPSKHGKKKVFKDVLDWIKKNCTSGELKRYDYAIDVPFKINDIVIYNSKKEPGLYKGTIYRGQRNKHGFTKIYNKAKEQNIDTILTRIETTIEHGKPIFLENIMFVTAENNSDDKTNLSNLNRCILNLCLALREYHIDFESYISALNYRRRKVLEPYLYSNTSKLELDNNILNQLLEQINDLFEADINCIENNINALETDFIEIDDTIDLPFE